MHQMYVVISGGGICGLATAISFARIGHRVTVFEANEKIEETVGAGLQVAPNMSRVLFHLGLEESIREKAVIPRTFMFRRWETGELVGGFRMSECEQKYGSPWLHVHRADLHLALRKRAEELGVELRAGCKIVDYDVERPSVELENGVVVTADLVVAADGVRSLARQRISGRREPLPEYADFDAYRMLLPISDLENDPELKWLVEEPCQNNWIGPDRHLQFYPLKHSNMLNMVWCVPRKELPEGSDNLSELKRQIHGWDKRLHNLLEKVSSCKKTPIWMAVRLEKTVSSSGNFVVAGDAAHDMTPFLGQGSAMAVEDAVFLSSMVSKIQHPSQVSEATRIYESCRKSRIARVKRESLLNCSMWHLHDGQEQIKRDREAHKAFIDGDAMHESSYIWDDEERLKWLYEYDAEQDAQVVQLLPNTARL